MLFWMRVYVMVGDWCEFLQIFFPGCGVFVEVLRPTVLLVSDKTVYVPI